MEGMELTQRTDFLPEELEALLKFIPSPQLLKLRQVSKELDEAAKMVLRKRRDIKLILKTDNFDSKFNWEFFLFLNNSPENVFVAPVIHVKTANKPQQDLEEGKTCVTLQIIGEICKRLGNRGIIPKLIIEDGYYAPHYTPDFILTLVGHFSALKTLTISGLQFTAALTSEENSPKLQLESLKKIYFNYHGSDVKEAANFLKIILQSSPNLEKITGWDLHKLNTMSMLRETGRLSKLKELILTQSTDLDILIQCKPKMVLNSLQIEIDDLNTVDTTKLFAFLQQQAVNLKSFKCEGHSKSIGLGPGSIFTLPLLPVLEKLSFKPWRSGCLMSANYGRHTPALKTLKINSLQDFESWDDFLFYETSAEKPPCLALEELSLFISGLTFPKMFDNWKNIFPNLKKLSIGDPEPLDIFDFDEINKCWPKLEELALYLCTTIYHKEHEDKDLDEILFGISPDWKRKIDTTEEEWWMKIPEPEIEGTVAILKNLQKLEVKVQGFGASGIVTDFAVYFGLKYMQNLKVLDISAEGPDMEDISKEAFNFLVKKLPQLEKLNVAWQKWERGEPLK